MDGRGGGNIIDSVEWWLQSWAGAEGVVEGGGVAAIELMNEWLNNIPFSLLPICIYILFQIVAYAPSNKFKLKW